MNYRDTEHLRVLIANERKDRLALVAPIVAALGHEVIAREIEVADVGAVTARERPDVALVGLGESSDHALGLIEKIVQEAACPVIVLIHARDPDFVKEASKRGVFAHISDADVEDWQSSIDIVLRRFAEYHDLEGAFGRRALIERAKGILMERHSINDASAFEMLREHSRTANRKLVDVATAVVDGHRLLPKHPHAPPRSLRAAPASRRQDGAYAGHGARIRCPSSEEAMMEDAVIVSALRTPVGSFGGQFKDVAATELGACAVRAALERAEIAGEEVDEVVLGCVLTAGLGQNPARQVAIGAGIPKEVPATTINMVCGSGLKAVAIASQMIRAGDVNIVVAGGMENMTRAPYLMPAARFGARMGDAQLIDSMVHDGLWDAFNDIHMGITAENLAEQYGISREEQDEFAAGSQQKAERAVAAGSSGTR